MKAFVIKNKEGKYLQYFDDPYRYGFTDNLLNAMFYGEHDLNDAIKYALKTIADCEKVVEITIKEGDLEQVIRKQVCEEIFKELQENTSHYFEERKCNSPHSQLPYIWFNEIRFRKFLDKIEQKGDYVENDS